MNEEATPTPPALPPQVKSQASSTFSANPISQPVFSLVTPEACLTYANYWYVMAQIQTFVEQGQNPVPPPIGIAQPFRVGMSSSSSM